jgi:hypothetical protein
MQSFRALQHGMLTDGFLAKVWDTLLEDYGCGDTGSATNDRRMLAASKGGNTGSAEFSSTKHWSMALTLRHVAGLYFFLLGIALVAIFFQGQSCAVKEATPTIRRVSRRLSTSSRRSAPSVGGSTASAATGGFAGDSGSGGNDSAVSELRGSGSRRRLPPIWREEGLPTNPRTKQNIEARFEKILARAFEEMQELKSEQRSSSIGSCGVSICSVQNEISESGSGGSGISEFIAAAAPPIGMDNMANRLDKCS